MPASSVAIPETITVHLGPPSSNAQNVTVPFADYIKNVASSEIYPTWPEQAIRANIYAQVSYVLNRVFTEWYRAQGYDFDITNSTRYDQSFVQGRDIFENISEIVDDMFNDYLTRGNAIEPLFAQYCNGTTTTCPGGLSQWGTVPLAEQGMSAEEIVRYFYGDDINFVRNAPISPNLGGSWPGVTFRLGDISEEVRIIQNRLNRIAANYPNIPKIYPADGIFDADTERAVRAFQQQFNLTADGIVGRATWYRIAFIYNNVKRLSELDSEGLLLERGLPPVPRGAARGRDRPGGAAFAVLSCHCGRILRPAAPLAARADRRCVRPADARGRHRLPTHDGAARDRRSRPREPGTSWSPLTSRCSRHSPHRNGWSRRSVSRIFSWWKGCAVRRFARRSS